MIKNKCVIHVNAAKAWQTAVEEQSVFIFLFFLIIITQFDGLGKGKER